MQGAGFMVQGAGCMVSGSGFRVQGAGCRIGGGAFGRVFMPSAEYRPALHFSTCRFEAERSNYLISQDVFIKLFLKVNTPSKSSTYCLQLRIEISS